jgi:acetate kinase
MIEKKDMRILTINSGSSSLKFALYDTGGQEKLILSGAITGIGSRRSRFNIEDDQGNALLNQALNISDHEIAAVQLLRWLKKQDFSTILDAVGHRVVHGGSKYFQPRLVGAKLMEELHDLIPIAPDHLPLELSVIGAVGRYHPQIKQVVCFDTAFHRTMPELAQIYALPRLLTDGGIIRYGFHGLSYEYIVDKLRKDEGPAFANGRIIIAHLGSGASMAAVKAGKSIETTMGFTPTGGLMMSTRSGDLDPGVIFYLLRQRNLSPSSVADIVNKQAGLLGVSRMSPDMKELLARQENPDAAEAVNLFCYQAKKFLASLCAVLGGLDTLVFTGGMGENAPQIRQGICENMGFLGIHLDSVANELNAPVISRDDSEVSVRVMQTNEQLMIARHVRACLAKGPHFVERAQKENPKPKERVVP